MGSTYSGNVGGDCGDGNVDFTSLSIPWGTKVLHLTGEYVIKAECSFTAVCSGILNTRTGEVVLNGVVTVGDYLGASVEVRAQAYSSEDGKLCSRGTMTITPSGQE